ncbi:MAG: exodeoxyribonuclease VII small subunit [Gammaproteobacteria bacterium GWE2_42_36]|nr:MAG: exodeoxyribonuclease VII small subunit [Gammaproteobacteria bacterium GWE2_42_36]HCU05302.1 exodeoxyribonuclease VII small subunit [Coxiellaceae bacterium]
MSTKVKKNSLEDSIQKLEQLIHQLETEKLALTDALKCFEEGVSLIRACQNELSSAEQKIQKLSQKSNTIRSDDAGENLLE